MNKLISILLVLAAHCAYAQQHKATGGCGGSVTIDSICPAPAHAHCYLPGDRVSAYVSIRFTGCDGGNGNLLVADDSDAAVLNNVDAFGAAHYTLPLTVAAGKQGYCIFTAIYHDYWCGDYQAYKTVDICAPPDTADLRARINAMNGEAEYVPVTPGNTELAVYPVPATDKLYITGLQPGEETCTLSLTDMQGRSIEPSAATLHRDMLTVPIATLPTGIYLLHLQTPQRTFTHRVSVVR